MPIVGPNLYTCNVVSSTTTVALMAGEWLLSTGSAARGRLDEFALRWPLEPIGI